MLLGGNDNIAGLPLSHFVNKQYEGQLHHIQNELRAERARREPTYLPAIYDAQQEKAAVCDLDLGNVTSLSEDFQDRQAVLSLCIACKPTEQFLVRIRLARTSTFFATMVVSRLQSPAPAVEPNPYAQRGQYAITDSPTPVRSYYHISHPGSHFSTIASTTLVTTEPECSGPGTPGMQPPSTPSQHGSLHESCPLIANIQRRPGSIGFTTPPGPSIGKGFSGMPSQSRASECIPDNDDDNDNKEDLRGCPKLSIWNIIET